MYHTECNREYSKVMYIFSINCPSVYGLLSPKWTAGVALLAWTAALTSLLAAAEPARPQFDTPDSCSVLLTRAIVTHKET